MEVEDDDTLRRFLSRVISDARSKLFSILSSSRFTDLSRDWALLARSTGIKFSRYWGFDDTLDESDGSPRQLRWRPIEFPAVLVPRFVYPSGRRDVRDAAGFVDELRGLWFGTRALWPLAGI